MPRSPSLFGTQHFCEHCQKDTRFMPIHFAMALTGKSRPTLYKWMKRSWIHWLEQPNGRRLICEEQLIRKARSVEAELPHVQLRKVTNRPPRILPL
jgi:predicted DNA-binding transcriptional regulator AlpA